MTELCLGNGLYTGGARASLFIYLPLLVNHRYSDQITGWAGMIRVDGKTFQWMGAPGAPNVNQDSFVYTSTKSIFTMTVDGKVKMIITFLSPVTPNDMKRQSLTFSYLDVSITSLDGKAHDVQLYSDISAGGSVFMKSHDITD
jgi:hypothetical protein